MDKETGGPAFPGFDYIDQYGKKNPEGMTLRDYFAAKALQAHVQREDVFAAIAENRLTSEKVSSGCYAWADKMLEARKQ